MMTEPRVPAKNGFSMHSIARAVHERFSGQSKIKREVQQLPGEPVDGSEGCACRHQSMQVVLWNDSMRW